MMRLARTARTLEGGLVAKAGSRLTTTRWRSTVAQVAAKDNAVAADMADAQPWSEIPGPKPAAVVGNAWRFIPRIGNYAGLKQKQFLKTIHNEYGPVVKFGGMLGNDTIVFLSDPDDFEKVLRNDGQWPQRRGLPSMEYYQKTYRVGLPQSLATSQGKAWGEFRSSVNQVMMQPRNVKQYVEPIDTVTCELLNRMLAVRGPDGQMPDDFANELSKWAMESITYVALDTRLGALGNADPNSEAHAMIVALRNIFYYFHQLDFRPSIWKYVTTPALRGLIKNMNYLNSVSAKYINVAMERLKTMPKSGEADRTSTVLEQLLLRTDDPGKAMAMANDMIIAGIDTTSVGLSVVLYHLAQNPEQQRCLQEELDRVVTEPQKSLTTQQLEDLKYMKACIKEAFRLEPVASSNMRNIAKDLVLGGYHIPEGTPVVMNNFIPCVDERYFPRAQEFLPERWMPEGAALKSRHPFAYSPFGFGPRMCVGRRFADLELEIAVARVFRRFSVEWEHPPPATDVLAVLRFESPLKFTVKDRA